MRDMDILKRSSEGPEKVKRLEHHSYEERLRAGTVQPEAKKIQWILPMCTNT